MKLCIYVNVFTKLIINFAFNIHALILQFFIGLFYFWNKGVPKKCCNECNYKSEKKTHFKI
jgi:hypothetical protein